MKSYTLYICCCRLFLINDLFIYLAHPNFNRFSFHSSTVLYSLGNGSFVLETFIIRIYEFRALLFQSMPSDSSLFCRWYRYCCCLGLKFNNDFCCALLSLLYWQNILLKIHTSGSQLHFDANALMQTGYTFTFVFVFWRMRVYVRNECTSIQWGMLTHAYMAKLFLKGNAHLTYTFRLFRANLKTSWIFFLRWFNFHLQPNDINLNSIAGFLQSYLIFSNKFFLFNL